jgi:hypothetical protein
MRWLVALLSLTVLCAIFGSVGVLVMGKPWLKLAGQVVSLNAKPSQPVPMQRVAGEQPKVQGL